MAAREQFTDGREAEWEPGVVVGIRRWRVAPDGHLLPLTGHGSGARWRPFLNTARCTAPQSQVAHFTTVYDEKARRHVVGQLPVAHPSCTCGYYGFHTLNRWAWKADMPVVEGVIEVHGHATIGSKGFRAEHARITALHVPPGAGRTHRALRAAGFRTSKGVLFVALMLLGIGLFLLRPLLDLTGGPALAAAAVQFVALFLAQLTALFGAPAQRGLHPGPRPWPVQVAQAYPGVPVYRTRAGMLRAHPLSGPPPDDETPVDPDRPDTKKEQRP